MFSCKEVKPEPEEAEICLPVNHHLHISCSHSYSNLGRAVEPTEPKLVPDCVKTECDLSPERLPDQTPHLRRTEENGHPACVTQGFQRNLPITNESKEINITEFKKDPAERFDDFLEDFIKQKSEEEAVNLNQTEDVVLCLSECEVSRSRVCRTLIMYKRIKISNGDTNCPKDANRTFSKPNTIYGTDESQRYTGSISCKTKDKTVEGHQKNKKSVLEQHQKTHAGGKPFTCTECDKGFIHQWDLKKHQKSHTIEKPFTCTEGDSGFVHKRDLKKHQKSHSVKKTFTCTECGHHFQRSYSLKRHMSIHTEPCERKRHSCQLCGKAFYRNEELKLHMRVHTGRKPYTCNECGKSFSIEGNLKRHQHRHTGERPHRCDECGRRFADVYTLKKHQMSHTGEKPYTCTECGHSFQRSNTLKKHMRIHTGERPYLCSECGKTFPYAFSYSTHMTKVHNS